MTAISAPATTSDAPPAPAITVPAGAPRWVTPELLADTLRVWRPYYPNLTPQEGLSIILNVTNLFDVLRKKTKP